MKKKLLVATALAGMFAAGTVSAQSGHEMMQAAPPAQQQDAAPQQTFPSMGPGMMGGGMGMGPGMMGGGMGPGMMGGGMGMMGGGMGMGSCGQMGGMMGNLDPENQQKYLDATKDLRKTLNDKQFEYLEAARNPKTSKADLLKKRKELWDIQHKIHEKAWEFIKE